ncbi:unnamed protein product [Dimorphilus gyrociliatus]|uniref:L-serine ammonia-lyase n=1 Tax=Dimorphilus gyrociliatus TaxID=2664684 RepID=A0A7I8VJ06_9ANNE|nr:unnamed protein product [Dimorphilus gyrociliatus]
MSLKELSFIDREKIEDARRNLEGIVTKSPLLKLNTTFIRHSEYNLEGKKIYIKLENLQDVGSFKIRGAVNALRQKKLNSVQGVYTCSVGNFAHALAYGSSKLGVPCSAVVPPNYSKQKIMGAKAFGASIKVVEFDEFWQAMSTGDISGIDGTFIHPVCDEDVIAGHGTIGLEILEDLPDVNQIIVPFGGGGLACGIASAVRGYNVKVTPCEVDVAAPLKASQLAGKPTTCKSHTVNFVDGMSGTRVFDPMWNLINNLLEDSIALSLESIAGAMKILAEGNRVIAEGAGAAPIAAALSEQTAPGNIVCVVSGGNIDLNKFCTAMSGIVPE